MILTSCFPFSLQIPDPCQTRPEPSPSPSLGCCFSTGPSQEEKMARLLYSSSIACSVPGTSCRNQDTAPATAPPDLLTTSSPAEYMEDQQQMALTTMRSPSCPQQGISVIISTTGACEFFLGGSIF